MYHIQYNFSKFSKENLFETFEEAEEAAKDRIDERQHRRGFYVISKIESLVKPVVPKVDVEIFTSKNSMQNFVYDYDSESLFDEDEK